MPPQEKKWVGAIESTIMRIGEYSSWIYLFIGVIVAYEVVLRYFFNAPTDWVEETSRLGMVWATFLLFPACMNRRQLISITLLSDAMGERGKMILEGLAFAIISIACAFVAWEAMIAAFDSAAVGRATASVLRIPYWLFYLPVALGFLLFFIQAALELILLVATGQRRKTELSHEEI
jgi:C4-dicarboxylate transporter, DctQ subunit